MHLPDTTRVPVDGLRVLLDYEGSTEQVGDNDKCV